MARVAVDLAHGSRHDDLLAELPHPTELNRQRLQLLRPAGGVGVRPRDLRHHPQPVQDPARKADAACELFVDVDRVEVSGGAGVPDGHIPIRGDLELDAVAGRQGHVVPLTMFVQVPVQTVSPRWFVDTDSNT